MENLKEFWKVRDSLEDVAQGLFDLSDAFSYTGNTHMADTLYHKGAMINDLAHRLDSLVSDEVNGGLRRAQEATRNMIAACLGAVESKEQ